jgi:23S rRNA-intervening sequence protein
MKQFEELERGATADVRDLPSDQGREILERFRAERPNRAGSEFAHVNIAEGFERGGNQEFSQFLYIPKVRVKYSQIYVAVDQRYVATKDADLLKNR